LLLARAIVSQPKVIFLDEAMSALEKKEEETILQNIRSLNATIIVISHRLRASKFIDRLYFLSEGVLKDTE